MSLGHHDRYVKSIMIISGSVAGESVGVLFAPGIIPGILVVLVQG